MSFGAAFLFLAQTAAQPAVNASATPEPRAIASATATARILAPAVIDFDAEMERSVRARETHVQITRDRAGTVWAEFQ